MARLVLVAGSQGFVGWHLRAALTARGCEVVGIDRPQTGAEIAQDLGDPDYDPGAIARDLDAVDSIIYMAARIARGSSVDATARSNLRVIAEAPVRMLEAFLARGHAPHFVYCSTYKTYGPPASQPIDPERPPQRPDPWSYGSAKALAERLLAISAYRTGARYAVVRPMCIYGPGQHLRDAIPTFLRAAWEGEPPVVFGEGTSARDDVLAPDVAYCLAEAALRRAEGPFHAAGERTRTIFDVAQLCCDAVGELGGPRGLEPVRDRSKPAKWWLDQEFDLGRSRKLLDYAPTAMIEGLKWEARWTRAGAKREEALAFCPPPRVASRPGATEDGR